MKKKILRMAAFTLALTMLPGCGKSQEPSESTSINQAMLIEKSAQEQSDYTFPETFTGDWVSQEGKLTIHADAQVVAEQGTVLPTATVMPREFTEEDVDNLLQVFLKGEPLYGFVRTKQELKDWIDYINSPEWQSDPDSPERSPEQLEERREKLNAEYEQMIQTAPDEKPVVHGFFDSDDPNEVSGSATVDGIEYDVNISNGLDSGAFRTAYIVRKNYKYRDGTENWGDISKEDAVALAEDLMQELGFDNFALDDVQPGWEHDGTWNLYYTPTVNGIHISSIRVDHFYRNGGLTYQYRYYSASEETNPDTVSWSMENIRICVGKDGILSFTWDSPSTEPVVKESRTALMPFEDIASIANTMLPIVINGPTEAHSLVDLDQYNGFETRMDVNITKVSLTLMRIRDKGSLQGTIVPVWDFWGTWDWYDAEPNAYGYNEKGTNYTTEPLLTLNAIDGNVVSRLFGY